MPYRRLKAVQERSRKLTSKKQINEKTTQENVIMIPARDYSNYIGKRVAWQRAMQNTARNQPPREEPNCYPTNSSSGSFGWGILAFIGLILCFIVPPVGVILLVIGASKS